LASRDDRRNRLPGPFGPIVWLDQCPGQPKYGDNGSAHASSIAGSRGRANTFPRGVA
jgi:hypothetical protein